MSFVIKKALEGDRPEIFRLLEIANMHYIPSAEMPELTFENYFVACIDGAIAGFCGYKILSSTEAKTELMVVDPKFRGEGIGFKLQEFRMRRIYEQGIKTLITNTDIPATIDWYKKYFGYKEVGTLKKINEFGRKDIDCWTTLQVDLQQWAKRRDI